ncbi:uncharacterized protein B0H64DRAFT_41694 [Chaetomium fimeti]|uniref:Uncharacterized protein n=1 Tax=Chaetomium fimeti TaxID=1854472 RepID=A0AAE0HRW4_9PEZI|nr:hypothetical protein B0H64DRAFT_41694 [Chaetomium fimeti]
MNAHGTNGAPPVGSSTHPLVYYAVVRRDGNLRYAIYVETDPLPLSRGHSWGTLLQINGSLSIPAGLTFHSRACSTPLHAVDGICLRPVGRAPRRAVSGIIKECAKIPLATAPGGGPVLLPAQPPRNSLEWTNTAIDTLAAARLLLPLNDSDPRAVIFRPGRNAGAVPGLTLWQGEHGGAPAPVVHPGPRAPVVVPGQVGGAPAPVVNPGPQVPVVVPGQAGGAPAPVIHPGPHAPVAVPGQAGGVHVPVVVPWEHRLWLVVLSSLFLVALSAEGGWMEAVSYLLFILLLIR